MKGIGGRTEAETLVRFEPSPMRVLVRQTDDIVEQKPESKIIIPDKAKDNECARVGVVMAVGTLDLEAYPWPLKTGEIVLFHIHNALKVNVDGEELHLVAVDDVLGRFSPKDA